MAKHCTTCGHELRDTDEFCAECKMQVADAMAAATPITWETCIIDYWLQRETGSFGTSLLQFFADANRPQLTYVAEQSDEYAGLYNFPNPSGSEDVAALKQLINTTSLDLW